MNNLKIQFSIQLPLFPAIYMWIQFGLDKCETLSDYIDFCHYCFNEAEESNNEVRRHAHETVARVLYSKISLKSYESKII